MAEYLPPYEGEDGLFLFVPGPKKTPALRAAIVKPDAPYRFALPGSWREQKIANIQVGCVSQGLGGGGQEGGGGDGRAWHRSGHASPAAPRHKTTHPKAPTHNPPPPP